jgi:hypothetical protein
LEVWKPNRRVRKIASGSVLRILAPGSFRLRWTLDSSASPATSSHGEGSASAMQEVASSPSGLGLDFIDIATTAGRAATLRFSFLDAPPSLPKDTDYEVLIEPSQQH